MYLFSGQGVFDMPVPFNINDTAVELLPLRQRDVSIMIHEFITPLNTVGIARYCNGLLLLKSNVPGIELRQKS